MIASKICTKCKVPCALDRFSLSGRAKTQRFSSFCKECHIAYVKEARRANPAKAKRASRTLWIRRQFGLSIEKHDEMIAENGNVCRVCKLLPSEKNPFSVDHCHATGIVRGILCRRCNAALGLLRESPAIIAALAQYAIDVCLPIREKGLLRAHESEVIGQLEPLIQVSMEKSPC